MLVIEVGQSTSTITVAIIGIDSGLINYSGEMLTSSPSLENFRISIIGLICTRRQRVSKSSTSPGVKRSFTHLTLVIRCDAIDSISFTASSLRSNVLFSSCSLALWLFLLQLCFKQFPPLQLKSVSSSISTPKISSIMSSKVIIPTIS